MLIYIQNKVLKLISSHFVSNGKRSGLQCKTTDRLFTLSQQTEVEIGI